MAYSEKYSKTLPGTKRLASHRNSETNFHFFGRDFAIYNTFTWQNPYQKSEIWFQRCDGQQALEKCIYQKYFVGQDLVCPMPNLIGPIAHQWFLVQTRNQTHLCLSYVQLTHRLTGDKGKAAATALGMSGSLRHNKIQHFTTTKSALLIVMCLAWLVRFS